MTIAVQVDGAKRCDNPDDFEQAQVQNFENSFGARALGPYASSSTRAYSYCNKLLSRNGFQDLSWKSEVLQ